VIIIYIKYSIYRRKLGKADKSFCHTNVVSAAKIIEKIARYKVGCFILGRGIWSKWSNVICHNIELDTTVYIGDG
jgi:hypothetical protein